MVRPGQGLFPAFARNPRLGPAFVTEADDVVCSVLDQYRQFPPRRFHRFDPVEVVAFAPGEVFSQADAFDPGAHAVI